MTITLEIVGRIDKIGLNFPASTAPVVQCSTKHEIVLINSVNFPASNLSSTPVACLPYALT